MTAVNADFQPQKGAFAFSASGHAQAAQDGPNIVCAAVSMLCYTRLKSCLRLQERGLLVSLSHSFAPGEVRIFAEAAGRGKRALTCACETVMGGFVLLCDEYPGQVEVRYGK
ncbi:MAG: ribosomal-processing cysteine protease Prp [Christensenellales bacterium]